jgi:succinate dehydrogenase / fumarate reductase cytochrome b subunit
MSTMKRPLSPHLSVYRWPITMTLSILHRISGIALTAGLVIFAAWLVTAASGAEQYNYFIALLDGLLGRVLLAGWSFAFFFHLSNGVRHLFWDAGYGFEKGQANASAVAVIIASVALTLVYWLTI